MTHDARVASAADRVVAMRDGEITSEADMSAAHGERDPLARVVAPGGMTVLRAGTRIVRADLAARPLPSVLTGPAIAVAAGALLVTVHLRSALDAPFSALSRATNGSDVVGGGPAGRGRPDHEAPPGVAPRRCAAHRGRRRGGRGTARPAAWTSSSSSAGGGLDRPLVLKGRAANAPGEIVLDDGLSGAERLPVGATVEIGGARLRVVGTAITTQHMLVNGWVTPRQIRQIRGHRMAAAALLLRDRSASRAFVAEAERTAGPRTSLAEWQQARDDYTEDSRRMLTIVSMSTLLALLAAGFTLATALGGRVIGERRRIGLLRAVGFTPRGVTGLLVAHYVALAAVAAPIGLLIGRLLAPAVQERAAVAIGAPHAAPPGPAQLLGVLAAVLALVALTSAVPAWRAGRVAPVEALAFGRGAGAGRASRLAALARRLRLRRRPRARRQGRLRTPGARGAHRGEPRPRRRPRRLRHGLRGDDGPPGLGQHAPGAALGPARPVQRARAGCRRPDARGGAGRDLDRPRVPAATRHRRRPPRAGQPRRRAGPRARRRLRLRDPGRPRRDEGG